MHFNEFLPGTFTAETPNNIYTSKYKDAPPGGMQVSFFIYVERAVSIAKKSRHSLLDAALKIGGLLGFLKLFTTIIQFMHRSNFISHL